MKKQKNYANFRNVYKLQLFLVVTTKIITNITLILFQSFNYMEKF